ncbi:hypothetical protein RMATCC62417_08056 [Rhizopus microsporus]|nr:hypothetical protein RMATCC62417_08056 [Rhizopus microsporus]
MGTESFPVLTDTGLNGHYESTNDIIIQSSTALHSSVRWLASRKSSTTVCTQVQRNGESPVAGVHHIRRLSDPMVFQTDPMAAQRNDIYNRRTSSRRFSSGEAPSSRDNREISFSIKVIPLQLLYDPRTYQKASNSRLPKTQQVRPMLTLQNGRYSSTTGHRRRRRPHDLKDAYVVVPMHEEPRPFLSFLHKDIVYQYRSLAFGLSVSPRVFSKLMRYAMEPLRKQGIRLVYYLDDICLLEKSTTEMKKITKTAS